MVTVHTRSGLVSFLLSGTSPVQLIRLVSYDLVGRPSTGHCTLCLVGSSRLEGLVVGYRLTSVCSLTSILICVFVFIYE